MNKRPPVSNSRKHQNTDAQSTGGREFGEVVEPMQAQMASGNEGLAETSPGVNPARTTRRTKRAA